MPVLVPLPDVVRHLIDRHGFGFDDLDGTPPELVLDPIHADLHDQEAEHSLPTHVHQWVVVEIHSGKVVSPALPTEELAMRHVLAVFGHEGGKEYLVHREWEESA